MVLLKGQGLSEEEVKYLLFTFQCGSIKSQDRRLLTLRNEKFTFQCGSIKSIYFIITYCNIMYLHSNVVLLKGNERCKWGRNL